ncbi:MAG: hypothetical protein FJ288_14810 [Planctomycetes bacterium]|nr:hypothetical protein [Planctomycetota bacterium]
MPRFVVQQHFRSADDWHYDLMLECREALVTFSSGAAPDDAARLPCLVRQLPNHRLAYLDREGEISGNRGWCRIHDQGEFEWIDPPPHACPTARVGETACDLLDAITIRLAGRKARGVYHLARETRSGADYWRLRRQD